MIAADSSRRGSVLQIMRLWRFSVFPCWLSTKRENLKVTALPRSRARPPNDSLSIISKNKHVSHKLSCSSPQLPNNKRSLVPGASCPSHFNDCRCRYVKVLYEICIKRCKGRSCRTGWVWTDCLITSWKPPPPIPDQAIRLCFQGEFGGFFIFYTKLLQPIEINDSRG